MPVIQVEKDVLENVGLYEAHGSADVQQDAQAQVLCVIIALIHLLNIKFYFLYHYTYFL